MAGGTEHIGLSTTTTKSNRYDGVVVQHPAPSTRSENVGDRDHNRITGRREVLGWEHSPNKDA